MINTRGQWLADLGSGQLRRLAEHQRLKEQRERERKARSSKLAATKIS